ncbi:hypothetical protein GF389_03600 [Candidatus Dojkabacteria bacterium]|nr:hypothetical protein [Candidatus Dojkabacteria bacterium]
MTTLKKLTDQQIEKRLKKLRDEKSRRNANKKTKMLIEMPNKLREEIREDSKLFGFGSDSEYIRECVTYYKETI